MLTATWIGLLALQQMTGVSALGSGRQSLLRIFTSVFMSDVSLCFFVCDIFAWVSVCDIFGIKPMVAF